MGEITELESPFTATCVSALLSSGAHLVGKTQMDEFGMGSHTTNTPKEWNVQVWNPLDIGGEETIRPRSCGGSSGGSAAAVASGLAWA